MQNVLVLLTAIGIGYALGWYQYSYSAEESAVVEGAAATKKSADASLALQAKEAIHQLDSDRVSEAVETISTIENVSYTDLAGLVLSPTIEKINNIIDGMNEDEVRLALNSVTAFDDQDLKDIDDPSRFAKRLLSVALFKEEVVDEELKEDQANVVFGASVQSNNSVAEPSTQFTKNSGRLYASFSLQDKVDEVFIKWFQNAPYNLKLFNKYTINKTSNNNYVWYSPQEWQPGLYTVEVYALDTGLTRLASGSFTIEE